MKINKITLILRGYSLEECLLIADEANKYNFNLEVTTNTENWEMIVATLLKKKYDNLVIGVGTVLDMDLLKKVINIGARFVLSPVMMTKEMIDYCKENDVKCVPSAFTPSEYLKMKRYGADIIKLFPAIDLPNRYLKDIFGPLGKYPTMVVGGVSLTNVNDFFQQGATYAGIGSNICNKEDLKNKKLEPLKNNLLALSRL